jgi:hypothetical protein
MADYGASETLEYSVQVRKLELLLKNVGMGFVVF